MGEKGLIWFIVLGFSPSWRGSQAAAGNWSSGLCWIWRLEKRVKKVCAYFERRRAFFFFLSEGKEQYLVDFLVDSWRWWDTKWMRNLCVQGGEGGWVASSHWADGASGIGLGLDRGWTRTPGLTHKNLFCPRPKSVCWTSGLCFALRMKRSALPFDPPIAGSQ